MATEYTEFTVYDEFEKAQRRLHAEGKRVETYCNPDEKVMWIKVFKDEEKDQNK